MVIFDFKELKKASDRTGIALIDLLIYSKSGRLPKTLRSKLLQVNKQKILAGHSFLLNESVLADLTISPEYIEQYITLAAKRSYTLYKMYRYKRLPLSMYPDLNRNVIKYNPLLKCTDTELVFLPEEDIN